MLMQDWKMWHSVICNERFIISYCSLLMSAVSGEDMQDRTDRAILTPWLKFLWESYRQCLDLLRNNQSVEKLYHEVAQNG
jgi:hypothetical protein